MDFILGTIFVSIEIFVAGFVFFQAITIGGWWIAGLIAYLIWLRFLGLKGALLSIFTGLALAITYILWGYVASLAAYVILLMFRLIIICLII